MKEKNIEKKPVAAEGEAPAAAVQETKSHKHRKKKFLLWAGALLLAVALGLTFLFACSGGAVPPAVRPSDSKNIVLTPPTDGSTPADYGALENIGYIIGRLNAREYYHTFSEGKVSAKVGPVNADQDVLSTKDYKDGVLITSQWSVSHSMFVKSKAIQKFFGDGTAVVREAVSSDPEDWDWETGATAWKDGSPSEILNAQQYEEKYGLWATEISDYVINETTFLSATDPVYADGVYTMDVTLDPETSTYYYKNNMRTMGGLKDTPVFESVTLTMRYTDDWSILSYRILESYSVKMGVTAKTAGDTLVSFSYDEADVDISAFDTYFKNYADAAPTGAAEAERGVAEYLAEGFGFVLEGKSALDVDVNIAGRALEGTVYLDMADMQLRSARVLLGGEDGLDLYADAAGGMLYLRYKGVNAKVSLSAIGGLLGGDGAPALDTDALMAQVMSGTLVKDGANVNISCGLSLFGMDIPLSFSFTEDESGVALRGLNASIDLGGLVSGLGKVELSASRGDASAQPAVFDTASAVDLAPYIEAILSVAGSDAISFELADLDLLVGGTEMLVSVEGTVWRTDGLQLRLDLQAGDEEIGLSYVGGAIRLACGGYYMQFTRDEIESIAESVSALLGEKGSALSADLTSIMQLFGENGIDLAALLDSLELAAAQDGASLAFDLAALIGGTSSPVRLIADAYGNGLSLRLAEGSSVGLFGVTVSSFRAIVEAPAEAGAPEAVGGAECANIFEFILRSYNALADTDTLSLALQYEAEGMSVGMKGAVQFADNAQDGNIVVNLTLEGVIAAGESNYFIRATVVGQDVYIYFSTVGFDGDAVYYTDRIDAAAVPLRARFSVSSLFDAAADAMPLIVSLMGLDKDDLYYYTFVVDILGQSYETINSDIFDTKSTKDWAELIVGIVREYTGKEDADTSAASESGVSVSFDFEDRALTVAGEGMNISLAADPDHPAPAAPAQAYTDYSALSLLVGVMMNSITTESSVPDGGDAIQSAEINRYYYLQGSAKASIKGLSFIGFLSVEIKLYASVYIHDDHSVTVNLYLDIPDSAGTNESDVYVTIEGGMVYLLNVKDGGRTYRVTTLDNFFGDFLKHINFLFNFNSLIANNIPTEPTGSAGGVTDIGSILTSFSYDGAASEGWPQQWTLGANLGTFTDGVIGSATVVLGADADDILKDLTFTTSVSGFVDLNATLSYANPGTSMGDAVSNGDVTKNIAKETEALFGSTIEGADWANTSYLEGSSVTLNYTLNGSVIGSQQVMYDGAGKLISELALPDLSGYAEGYTYQWIGEPANGSTEFAVTVTPNVYEVILRSEYEIEGYTPAYKDGNVFVYELDYTYGTTLPLPVGAGAADAPGYELKNFVGEDGAPLSEVKGILEPVTLTAVWDEIEYTVTYLLFGQEVGTQTYHYGDPVKPLESVEGYEDVEWESVSTVTGDMTVNAVYASVTVTLASDFAAEGFNAGEGGYYREYTLSGVSAEDFALSCALTREGYTQFGWWQEADGGWQNVTSLAGRNGQTVWTVWVNKTLTVDLTTVSKSGMSTWTFAGKYTAFDAGSMSAAIADAAGIESTANVWHTLRLKPLWMSERDDPLNDGKALSASGGTFDHSGMNSLYGVSGTVYYGTTKIEATYTYNGLTASSSGSARKDY